MKNTLKRLGALLIAAIMMIAMCVPVMADPEPVAPSDSDKSSIKVIGIADEDTTTATVKAYLIVEPTYNDQGLVSYKKVDELTTTIADLEKPTSDEIKAAATYIMSHAGDFTTVTLTKNSLGDYVSPATGIGAGAYLVIVSGTNTAVYNPAVVSINYTDANDSETITPGEVDLDNRFNPEFGSVAYLKKSEPTLDKSIVVTSTDAQGETTSTDVNGTTVSAKGNNTTTEDTISFKISAVIPSYAMTGTTTTTTEQSGDVTTTTTYTGSTYVNPIVRISDKLDDTFNDIDKTTFAVTDSAGQALTLNTDYKVVWNGNKAFTVTLENAYLLNHGGLPVYVTYSTTLRDIDAAQNYAENANTAKYEYSNDPTKEESVKTLQDVTYNYTFAIDGMIDAEADEDDGNPDEVTHTTETHELNKVTETTEVTTWTEATGEVGETTTVSGKKLPGAEFTLYTQDKFDATNKKILSDAVGDATATSDGNGHIYFHGLNAGTYYIRETKAPSGYTINDTIYEVIISASLNDAGILTGHSVTFKLANGADAGHVVGSITYTNTAAQDTAAENIDSTSGDVTANDHFGKVTNTVTTEIQPLQVVDTPLPNLPSTGGVGSFVFTVVGVAVMVLMAASFFRSRTKKV